MKEPKTKPNTPPPKTLGRSIRPPKGVKTSLTKSVDNIRKVNKANKAMQKHMPDNQQYDKPENYATDNVIEKGEYITRKAGSKTINEVEKASKKGYEKIREHHQVKQREKFESRFNDDVKHSTTSRVKSVTKETAKQNSNIRHTQSGNKTVKSAIHTGKKTDKTVKATKKGVKNTKKVVKKTKKGVKAAAKTAKRTAQAAKKAAMIAKKAAVAAEKTAKLAVKAIVTAVKAAVAAIKGLIVAIAAGGWVVVLIIVIVGVIIAIISSPLAIFSNDTDGTTPTISEVVQQINGEYTSTIAGIIADAGDVDEVIVEGESASSEFHVGNWIDIIGVFSVKSTVALSDEEFLPVVYMEDRQINDLKDVFWDMNIISHEIVEEVIEPDQTPMPSVSTAPSPSTSISPTPEPTPEIYRTLIISIECKTYEDGIELYNMSDEQIEVLEELMTPDYIPMYMEICGMDSYIGLTSEQMANLINDLPEGELGSDIVEYAISRLGHPYSRPKRGQGNYVDCSYLARWCYQQAGVMYFTAGTAAEQTRYCVNNGLCVAYSDLQPGDLIFWSFNANGRFMNVTHVGIYAGDGYVIDASSSRGMVVYRPVFGESSIVACGRPHVLN